MPINYKTLDDLTIAIPDTMALTLLVGTNKLDSFLAAHQSFTITITDVVLFDVSQNTANQNDMLMIRQFLTKYADRISTHETQYGKMLLVAAKNTQDFDFPSDAVELSIIGYLKDVSSRSLDKPILVIIEDDWFNMHTGLLLENIQLLPVTVILEWVQNA